MATLSVTVSGSPIPTEENIIWYYEGVPLNANGQYSFGASNRELTINSVESGDYGEYVCEVNTTVGIDRASIMLLEPSKSDALMEDHQGQNDDTELVVCTYLF